MNLRAFVSPLLFLAFGLLLGTSAHAAAILKGTIQVAGAKTDAGLTGPKCDDIVVEVASKAQTSRASSSGPLPRPRWQRYAKATGSWASGSCSYSMNVVVKSEFYVVLGTDVETNCDGYNAVSSTPPEAGSFEVLNHKTKDQNFKLDAIYCVLIK